MGKSSSSKIEDVILAALDESKGDYVVIPYDPPLFGWNSDCFTVERQGEPKWFAKLLKNGKTEFHIYRELARLAVPVPPFVTTAQYDGQEIVILPYYREVGVKYCDSESLNGYLAALCALREIPPNEYTLPVERNDLRYWASHGDMAKQLVDFMRANSFTNDQMTDVLGQYQELGEAYCKLPDGITNDEFLPAWDHSLSRSVFVDVHHVDIRPRMWDLAYYLGSPGYAPFLVAGGQLVSTEDLPINRSELFDQIPGGAVEEEVRLVWSIRHCWYNCNVNFDRMKGEVKVPWIEADKGIRDIFSPIHRGFCKYLRSLTRRSSGRLRRH